MFSLRSLSTAAAFIVLAGAPLAASAVETSQPIAVTSCSVDTQAQTFSAYGQTPAQFGNVYLSFTNNASVAATNVELLVAVNGNEQRIDTAGTFAPGIRIDRITSAAPYLNANDVTCRIAKVDFSNGTSWNALAALPKTTAQR
jgi:hypothetical protein